MGADRPDLTVLADRARRVAVDAADHARSARRDGLGTVGTKSSATDPVTEIDRSTEARIVDALLAEGPDDAVLGEEDGGRTGTSGIRWVIDPIDGTVNFVYGLPAHAVSVAAELDDEPVVGVVVDIPHGTVHQAIAGGGGTGPDGPLRVTDVAEPSSALIGTGFGYVAARREAQAEALTTVLPRVRDIRRAGSAAMDLCSVAAGRLDGFYELGLGPWDLAAGAVLVREAGGVVQHHPSPVDEAEVTVAAGPALIDPLVDLLREAGAVR